MAERDTGRPIPGAVVRPYYEDFFGDPTGPGRPVRTDARGRATVRVADAIRIYGFTVEAEGYEQYLPLGWRYSAGSYEGEAAADGSRVLHVRPVTPVPALDGPPEHRPADDDPATSEEAEGAAGAVEGFKLAASLDAGSDTLPATDPVLLGLRIENTTDGPLHFFHMRPEEDYELWVSGAGGKEVPLTVFGRQVRDARESRVVRGRSIRQVRPGESMAVVLHVNRMHDMTAAGEYTIRASRRVPERGHPGHAGLLRTHAQVWSAPVRVRIFDPAVREPSAAD